MSLPNKFGGYEKYQKTLVTLYLSSVTLLIIDY